MLWQSGTETGPRNGKLTVSEEEDEQSTRVFISAIDNLKSDIGWTVQLETNGTIVRYKLDTGAQVNVLPREVYASLKVFLY